MNNRETIINNQSFIAYKGFDKNLKCKDQQFVVGETFEKPERLHVSLCTDHGFHYSRKFFDVFSHYKPENGNRFCKVEILGNYCEDNKKGITTKIKILEEITYDKDVVIKERLNIDTVKQIQQAYPMFHVGGSVALFLHGCRLTRWEKGHIPSDIDMVSPYYVLPQSTDSISVEANYNKSSGNDFDECFQLKTNEGKCAMDLKIDPLQKYTIVEYEGFKFKVSPIEVILAAKLKYSLSPNGAKHKNDIRELMGLKKDLINNEIDF